MITSISVGELQKKTSLFSSSISPFLVRDARRKNKVLSLVIPLSPQKLYSEEDIQAFLSSYSLSTSSSKRTFIPFPSVVPNGFERAIALEDTEIESLFYDEPFSLES